MTNQLMVIEPEQFETTQRIAQAMVASGYFNDAKDVAQAIVKIMAGQELGLPPFAAMTSIHVIKGKPTLGANALATLVKSHPRYDYRVKVLDGKGCTIAFYENGDRLGDSSFSAADAKAAGLTGGNWQKFPRNMYFARAMSNSPKWLTPGIFGGAPVYTPDELGADVDGEGDIIDVTTELVTLIDSEVEDTVEPDDSDDEPVTNGNGGKYHTRPYPPETLKSAMQHKTKDDNGTKASDKQGQYAAACLSVITLDYKERYDLTEFLFGVRSTKELTASQASAIIDWVEYKKVNDEWIFNEDARQEAAQIIRQVAIDGDQQEMEFETK